MTKVTGGFQALTLGFTWAKWKAQTLSRGIAAQLPLTP